MPIRRSAFQVIAGSAKRAVRTEPKVSKPEGSEANAATPEPSVASSADSPSQSRNKTATTTINKTPIRTPQSVRRRKRPPRSTGKSIKPNAYELVAAAQASPVVARRHAVKHSIKHPTPKTLAPRLNHVKPASNAAAELGTGHRNISGAQVTPDKDPQPLTNDCEYRAVEMADFSQTLASEALQEGTAEPSQPSNPQTRPTGELPGTNSDVLSTTKTVTSTNRIDLDDTKPASTSTAESEKVNGKTPEAQDTLNSDQTDDCGSGLLVSAVGFAESVLHVSSSESLLKSPLPSEPRTSPVMTLANTNENALPWDRNKITTQELNLSHNEGTENLNACAIGKLFPDNESPELKTSVAVEPICPSADDLFPDNESPEPKASVAVEPICPSADDLLKSTDKVGNTELKRQPKKVDQPKEDGRSAFDIVEPLERVVSGGTQVADHGSLDTTSQSASSSPKPETKPPREPDEMSAPVTLTKSPTELKRTPRSELKLINPSSPEALVAMAEALERSQTEIRLASTAGGRHPSHPDSHKGNDLLSRNPNLGYQHRTVDLGSLHGNTFNAFLISVVCEILQFMYTSTPSTPLRLTNLVLAVSLYSGVFDTHVQRAPLGMMLNRLAAWIVALLALSTSIYTTPGEQWRTGEVLLVNMFGTLLFPLAVLDSVSVLWAEIRCRNFILTGFATENLYLYVLLLVTPIIRLLLTYDEAADLYVNYPLAETIYAVSVFSALIVAAEYYCVCQVAAGNFSKDIWQGMASILWGFLHAPGCTVLVGALNGINAGGYFYVGCFFVFVAGKALEVILEKSGGIHYRDTSTAPLMAAKKL